MSTLDDRSATALRKASSSRISGRVYSPDVPENRHGTEARLRLRRMGSPSALARTRIAKSRRRAPPATRSANPPTPPSSPPGAGGKDHVANGQLGTASLGNQSLVDAVANFEAIRVVEANQPVARVENWSARAVVPPQDHLAGTRVVP